MFIAFELPNEEKNREIKKNVALDVIDRMDYMAEVLLVNYVSTLSPPPGYLDVAQGQEAS